MKKKACAFLVLVTAAMMLSGCSNETTSAEEPAPEVGVFALLQHPTNRVFAYVHDDHWHGSLPAMNVEESMPLTVYAEDIDEVLITVDGEEHSLSTVVVGGDEDLVHFEFADGMLLLTAANPGESQVVFQLKHNGQVYFEAPPIKVTVLLLLEEPPAEEPPEEAGTEYGAVGELKIIDRSDGQVVADIHGDHWHGRLPVVPEGSYVSLGAVIEDLNGAEIRLDGAHYALGAAVAEGSEAIVRFESHGDHLHVVGEATGETRIVFQLLHDGSVVYETPPIRIHVTAP